VTDRAQRQQLGKLGEDIARAALTDRGYAILATRHRTRFGEIDIVARDGGVLVFVEVKARRSARHGGAIEAISPGKRRRVAAMALDYLAWTGNLEAPCRFDVVAIDRAGSPAMTVRVIDHAWEVDN